MQHRISKLPEPILQHILSFLHAKDVTRMSTLSKVWDSAWKSLPYLNFGDILDWSKDLNVVIDQALANRKKHKISIQKFSLCLCLGHYGGLCCVRNWIKILIACNIKELNLRVETHDYRGNFVYGSLPLAIFAAKSLNVLSLSGFSIEFPADDAINLEELTIDNLEIDNSYGNINVVRITACKALKILFIRGVDVNNNCSSALIRSLAFAWAEGSEKGQKIDS
ncbi:F-box/LRR-repeat protein At3g26922-like [Capsicum annuum]|uniref:F-box/LRR-repeat protein At3g26922-like n=1 Tax=Capsicum annuum TaxID=4072 RepID=UPI001FB15D36|nr:F-box/LRR-repeat protein At3g26922-like [Capsicum annuum]